MASIKAGWFDKTLLKQTPVRGAVFRRTETTISRQEGLPAIEYELRLSPAPNAGAASAGRTISRRARGIQNEKTG